jgi:hypothetical protein
MTVIDCQVHIMEVVPTLLNVRVVVVVMIFVMMRMTEAAIVHVSKTQSRTEGLLNGM